MKTLPMCAIDWQQLALTCRRYAPLGRIAKDLKLDWQHLNRLARGEVAEPRFNSGLRLIAWAGEHFTDDELRRCRHD